MLYNYCILLLISKFCSCMLPCIVFGKRTGTMKSESDDARIRFQSEVAGDGSPSATDVQSGRGDSHHRQSKRELHIMFKTCGYGRRGVLAATKSLSAGIPHSSCA